jgi:nucleoside-diphosphate-sugar epimerase
VAGGGGIALDVTRRLKDMGAWVWMLQRSESRRAEIEGMMAIVVRGDALVSRDVAAAFDQIEEVDAVVSTIGGTPADASADSEGNINLIKAAIAKGVKRFVLVTSIGTGDSKDAPPQQVYDVLEKVLLEKAKAEDYLKANAGNMEYTIIRPGGLKSEPATGRGVLTEDKSVCGAVHREDVAQLVAQSLFSQKAANKVLSAVDRSQLMGEPKFEDFVL